VGRGTAVVLGGKGLVRYRKMLPRPRFAEDDRVLFFFGAANRDPRRWENPDQFDITRKASGHVAFGLRIHGCVGKPVACIEGEMLLGALARKVGRIKLDGESRKGT
jgi:cytochrome P450